MEKVLFEEQIRKEIIAASEDEIAAKIAELREVRRQAIILEEAKRRIAKQDKVEFERRRADIEKECEDRQKAWRDRVIQEAISEFTANFNDQYRRDNYLMLVNSPRGRFYLTSHSICFKDLGKGEGFKPVYWYKIDKRGPLWNSFESLDSYPYMKKKEKIESGRYTD
jgi:hypothetical protein